MRREHINEKGKPQGREGKQKKNVKKKKEKRKKITGRATKT